MKKIFLGLFFLILFSPTTLFAEKTFKIPGKITASQFGKGSSGGALEPTLDEGGGKNIGSIDNENRFNYRVTVAESKQYSLELRVATPSDGSVIEIQTPKRKQSIAIDCTGEDWQTWGTTKASVYLEKGTYTLTVYVKTGGFNLNWLNFSEADSLPDLKGKLIFHRYDKYDDWNSQLFYYDFNNPTKAPMSISKNWNLQNAMNAHFSPDGKKIVFMASEKNKKSWDIFLYTFGDKSPVNLTKKRGSLREEDPKFSPDGKKIIFKDDLTSIKEMDLKGNIIREVIGGKDEKSMPYYTSDGKNVVYSSGDGKDMQIKFSNSAKTISGDREVQQYYPITKDANSFYFARWISKDNPTDQLYLGTFNGKSTLLPFNKKESDFSDPYPVDEDHLITSTRSYNGKGGYDLALANYKTGQVWNLDLYHPDFNSPLNELGASYTPF